MTPDDDCNNKFGQVRLRADATEDQIVQDSYRQVCLCDGYKAVASVSYFVKSRMVEFSKLYGNSATNAFALLMSRLRTGSRLRLLDVRALQQTT